MADVEKYIGESAMKDRPEKKLNLRIKEGAIVTDLLGKGSVTNSKIADDAVTTDKLSGVDNPGGAAVTTSKIVDNAVTESKIAKDAVTSDKIQKDAINSDHIKESAIESRNIGDGQVLSRHIQDNAVTSDKLSDADSEAGAAVTAGKIAAGAIHTEHIAANAVVAGNIASGAVQEGNIAAGAVTTGKIAANAVVEGNIAEGAVTTAKIKDGSVTTNDIATGAVTESKLAPGSITTDKLDTPVITQLQTIMDEVPTVGSVKPINSAGVLAHGSAFDVSEYNKSEGVLATYETLAAALAAVPATSQRGGMSIKYVQSSDNKYVQARCMAQNFTTDVTQWQSVNEIPASGSSDLVNSNGIDHTIKSIIAMDEIPQFGYTSIKDAAFCKRVLIGTDIESEVGSRLRIGFFNPSTALISVSVPSESDYSVAVGVYSSYKDALESLYWNALQYYTSRREMWVKEVKNYKLTKKGFISISIKKDDDSAITNAEITEVLDEIILNLQRYDVVNNAKYFPPSEGIIILPNFDVTNASFSFNITGTGAIVINNNIILGHNALPSSISLYQRGSTFTESTNLIYNISTNEFYCKDANTLLNQFEVVLYGFRVYYNNNVIKDIFSIQGISEFTINGKPYYNYNERLLSRKPYTEDAWIQATGNKAYGDPNDFNVYIIPCNANDVITITSKEEKPSVFMFLRSYTKGENTWKYILYNGSPRTLISANTTENIVAPLGTTYIAIGAIVRSEKNDFTPKVFAINGVTQELLFDYNENTVKKYGALGDGVTDDYLPLQKAFVNGGTINIGKGTYLLTKELDLYSDTKVVMDNNAVLLRGGTQKALVSAMFTAATTEYNGIHNISFEGGCLDMKQENDNMGSCVALMHGFNIRFRNVTFKHVHRGEHFIDMAACKNVRFDNCLFTEMMTIASSTEQIQLDVALNSIGYPYRVFDASSACYDGTPCKDIVINGNTFNLNNYSPAVGNHNPAEHEDIIICNNIINGTGKAQTLFDRGAFAFSTHSVYNNDPNKTNKCLIHHNIVNNCRYIIMTDTNSEGNIYLRDNIFNEFTSVVCPNSGQSIHLLNNIELNE